MQAIFMQKQDQKLFWPYACTGAGLQLQLQKHPNICHVPVCSLIKFNHFHKEHKKNQIYSIYYILQYILYTLLSLDISWSPGKFIFSTFPIEISANIHITCLDVMETCTTSKPLSCEPSLCCLTNGGASREREVIHLLPCPSPAEM